MRTVRTVRTVGMTTHRPAGPACSPEECNTPPCRATYLAALAVGSVGISLLLLAHRSYQLALILAIASAACALMSRQHVERAGKQGVGAKAEQQVSSALKHVDGVFHVINNATLPSVSGDCDHVVHHTKRPMRNRDEGRRGQVRINCDGKLVTGQGRVVPGNPINQVLVQAGALGRLTGDRVTAIVCVPWQKNAPFRSKGVWVCGASQLGWVLRQMDGHLTPQAADRLRDAFHELGAGGGDPSRCKDAELVALRIGEHDPRLLPLTDVHPVGTQRQQAVHLGRLVIRAEVQVQTVLGYLRVTYRHEDQAWKSVGSGPDFVLVVGLERHHPAQSVGPPPSQCGRLCRVHNDLLPFKAHGTNL